MKGSMLRKKNPREQTKSISSPTKWAFSDPVGHALPPSLQHFRWSVDKVERKLQEKIQEKTKIAGNFVYQQAYRLLECSRGDGIDFPSFKEQLRIKFGIILEDEELQLLFDKYDEDRNGTIDLNEFIRHVLPPDYNYGRQWFELSQQSSDEKQLALKRESRHEFLMGTGKVSEDLENMGEASHWTLDTLMKTIQMKVVQKTPSGDDQYRRAFKMLRSGRDQGIRMRELRHNLKTKFGIFISERQMKELFLQFDQDGSGQIDLQEFLQFVEPPAYTGASKVPGGIWTKEEEEEEEEEVEEIKELPIERPRSAINKKERPMSANPKKTAMLKQRREQQSSQLEKHWKETQGTLQGRRQLSLADIRIDSSSKSGRENESEIRTSRPRSAGSVTSSRAPSICSIRSAAYLPRPSTPQNLRQKVLESRTTQTKFESRPTQTKAVPTRKESVKLKPRGSVSHSHDTSKHVETSHEEFEAPRVMRVHAKQRDNRPYTQSGQILRRSKVSSAGCR